MKGVNYMSQAQAQALAHELTIEYIRNHKDILSDVLNNIPKMVDMIADINRRFYDSIIHNEKFEGLY